MEKIRRAKSQLRELHSAANRNTLHAPRTGYHCIAMTGARGIAVTLRVQRDILIIIHSGHYDDKVPFIASASLIKLSHQVTPSDTFVEYPTT